MKMRKVMSLVLVATVGASVFIPGAGSPVSSAAAAGTYSYESHFGLTSSFGWEGDKDAPIAYIDGSYQLRDRDDLMITFGVTDIPGDISWYNKEGYLPCFVSAYTKDGLDYVVESFSDMAVMNGNKYEIAYSRMMVTNNTSSNMALPTVSGELIPLNDGASQTVVAPGQTVVRDYAIGADRFGGSYNYPTDSAIAEFGDWDSHYEHMKSYWNDRLDGLATITKLPDESLINAYKAGYIYTLIIADGYSLNVGENGYDMEFDHDALGILSTLVTIGDFTNFKEYASQMSYVMYPDYRWKYSWPFALYLMKTGDTDTIRAMFDPIKTNTHYIETQRVNDGAGIMMSTNAIDSDGNWMIDNWAALFGLTTYRYICDTLGETAESDWAAAQYEGLLAAVEAYLQNTITSYHLDYLPLSMDVPNELSARSDPRDANWASALLCGRWAWDGYLFGADQDSFMIDLIDNTYTNGFENRLDLTDTIYNFGGYPHGYFSSAYNAGYASTALRGEEYRDAGIKAYQFMINESMSGPYGWWEGVDYPDEDSPWDIDHAAGGGGSCQHMWGQSTATKVLFDSLIAEKSDGTVIIGRGLPAEWIADGEEVEIADYPISDGKSMGYNIITSGNTVTLTLTGDSAPVSLELLAFKDNIVSAGGLSFDNASGVVTVPAGVPSVTVTLGRSGTDIGAVNEASTNLNLAAIDAQDYDLSDYTTISGGKLTDAVNQAEQVLADSSRTTEQLAAAQSALKGAVENLVPLVKGSYPYEITGDKGTGYMFGQTSDQIRRYQTFQTGDSAIKVTGIDVAVAKYSYSSGPYGDMTGQLYTVGADGKSLETLVDEVSVSADLVGLEETIRLPFDCTLEAGTTYALVLGQDRTGDVSSNAAYVWYVTGRAGDDLYFIKDTGNNHYVDESQLGSGLFSIYSEEFNRTELDTLVASAGSVNFAQYTKQSYDSFSEKIATATGVLENKTCAKSEYEAALSLAHEAFDALKPVNAEDLIAEIAALPDLYTVDLTQETAIADAAARYARLSETDQAAVVNYDKLTDLAAAVAVLKEESNGDVDGNGSTTVSDVVELRDLILKANPLTAVQHHVSDLNQDGLITVSDVVDLRDYIMKGK